MALAHKHEFEQDIETELKRAVAEVGVADSLSKAILTMVTEKNYEIAIRELKEYAKSKHEFRQFSVRANRFFDHCFELVNAIKTSRSVEQQANLSVATLQDVHERTLQHFESLKDTLKTIERIERDLRLDDVRSTVWVIRALVYSTFVIVVVAACIDVNKGILQTIIHVTNYWLDFVTEKFLSVIGW